MGNWLGRKQVVHPLDHDEVGSQAKGVKKRSLNQPSSNLQLKVRMTSRQLKELMAQVDLSKGNSELGRLILQECLEGRLQARVITDRGQLSDYARKLRFSTINE